MKAWWISWYNPFPRDEFELHSPWWVSGYRMSDDAETMVAAVRAPSEEEAMTVVAMAYDDKPAPTAIEWRFVRELNVSPFSDRFPQAEWMAWDDQRTCGCPTHDPTKETA
jgi:hypothetical protein